MVARGYGKRLPMIWLSVSTAPGTKKTLSPAFLNTRTTLLQRYQTVNFEVPLMRNDMGTGRY